MTIGNLYSVNRSTMMLTAQAEGNPRHIQHVNMYCDYADSVGQKIKQEIMAELPKLIAQYMKQPKVQVEVDEASLKRVKEKVQGLLDGIFRRR